MTIPALDHFHPYQPVVSDSFHSLCVARHRKVRWTNKVGYWTPRLVSMDITPHIPIVNNTILVLSLCSYGGRYAGAENNNSLVGESTFYAFIGMDLSPKKTAPCHSIPGSGPHDLCCFRGSEARSELSYPRLASDRDPREPSTGYEPTSLCNQVQSSS